MIDSLGLVDMEEKREFIFRGLMKGYKNASKNKKMSRDRLKFELNLVNNITMLTEEIMNETYRPSPGVTFVVMEPVPREVFAAPFIDRVVHHFLCDLTMEKFDKTFIPTSSSCRKGKGTLYAIRKVHAQMQSLSNNFSESVWYFKFDLQGFFMSLKRDLLWEEVSERLDGFYPGRGMEWKIVKFLWRVIIMDNPIIGVRVRGDIGLWQHIPKNKSLFHQSYGQGIVIGNLTSQLLSNIFLNKLDQYIVETFGSKYYGRYVDDFYLLVKEKDVKKIKHKIAEMESYAVSLGLKIHPKKRSLQNIKKGMAFLGAVIYPHRIVMGKRMMKNIGKEIMRGEKIRTARLQSYFGSARHYKSKKMLKRAIISAKEKAWD